ncbi:MAG: alpha/beta hydrolase [Clostridiales bacterium]|jgi:pimeloyl-ACP methyl ester carboxylesterase|nr:alpha/beta hydrolase [Clostridiales bacterium]
MEFTYKSKRIYYESHGEGKPLLILNGIFMSCASWSAFVPGFAKHNRLLLLDMLDQGKSEKMDAEYTQELQAGLCLAFLDHLGLDKVSIMGISYGGEVAMKIAAANPERIDRLILSNTAAYTSPWLRDIGHSWEYAFESYNGHQFFKTCIPIIYSPGFYERNYAWASAREGMFVKLFGPEVYDAFGRLTRSAESHDERGNLHKIKAKTLVISSEFDFITPPYLQQELAQAIPDAGRITLADAGHAAMYEKPAEFTAVVLGFLNGEDEIKIK